MLAVVLSVMGGVGYLATRPGPTKTAPAPSAAANPDLGGIDGLLGLSFLSRFKMTTDNAAGTIELVGRK